MSLKLICFASRSTFGVRVLRIAPEVADPVVQVINGDEEDIGPLRFSGVKAGRECKQSREQQRNQTSRSHR